MKDPKLTGTQIKQVRANIARSASQVSNRLTKCALGQLDLTSQQVNAAKILLGHVLPTQQQTQIEDVTDHMGTPEQAIEAMDNLRRELAMSMTVDELMELQGNTPETLGNPDSAVIGREKPEHLDA